MIWTGQGEDRAAPLSLLYSSKVPLTNFLRFCLKGFRFGEDRKPVPESILFFFFAGLTYNDSQPHPPPLSVKFIVPFRDHSTDGRGLTTSMVFYCSPLSISL